MALIKDGKIYRTFEEQMIYLTEDNSKIKSSIDNIKKDKQDKLTAGNNIIIDENSVISSNIDLSGKQDKLTAGDNITIEDNVISASGSGGEQWEDITELFRGEDMSEGTTVYFGKGIVFSEYITLKATYTQVQASPSINYEKVLGEIQTPVLKFKYVDDTSGLRVEVETLRLMETEGLIDKKGSISAYTNGINSVTIVFKYPDLTENNYTLRPTITKIERLVEVN